jgi:hypothetical protein
MGDAHSDIRRDEIRDQYQKEYTLGLLNHLKNPSDETYQSLRRICEEMDDIGRGYFGSKTNSLQKLDRILEDLLNPESEEHRREWARTLVTRGGLGLHPNYQEFKSLSPFPEEVVQYVDYGINFIHETKSDSRIIQLSERPT